MRYGSVCSGIEAATVAWHTLGFEPIWFSEIEKFPNAVLEHHYPEIPNLGDMTKITAKIESGEVEAPDILVGGTPCQAFSMAGLRNSLDDNRGQLTLEFVRLANAIDTARSIQGKPACIIVWENVPGVLNTKDNAFGCFLGGLSGERGELHSPGRKWTNTGYVLGPQRQVAWRTLDAQFFGLAQRRKRVFVVASARAECIAEILFERKGMSGNNQASGGEKKDTSKRSVRSIISTGADTTLSGKDTLSPILASNGQKMWLGNQEAFTGDYHIKHIVMSPRNIGLDCTQGFVANLAAGDNKQPKVLFEPIGVGGITANAAISKNLFPTLLARKEADGYVVHGIQGNTIGRSINAGGNGIGFKKEQAPTLTTADIHGVTIHGTQEPIVSYSHAHCLGRNSGQENVFISSAYSMVSDTTPKISKEINATLRSSGGGGIVPSSVSFQAVARYLTEIECERLQGFPDNYTNIPKASKSNRYKALGNSMAVPVMHWIGKRISEQCEKYECEHSMTEITVFGDLKRIYECGKCGHKEYEEWVSHD
ncbi:DNA cytosine methyltransferase [Acinetobacter pollinis]|uniref:DNA (cytosine-5-)-methyltransferase n=1 Tax=Acinetobacter pollinis TaxID=2605270 RepID=A0ABU6DNS7_9GAMM|nr:DNA cytosine methyltransferase [Acinetobacter pollinis]MEB5475516.1 DNA cytosine methyltransferase [Acinetobacter pollinis]